LGWFRGGACDLASRRSPPTPLPRPPLPLAPTARPRPSAQVPHSIALDASDTVYVADRENARIQVFTAAGAHRATWPSKAGLGVGANRREVWSRHVSSVSYNKQLDLLSVVEGGDVVLRTTSGCVLSQSAVRMLWPHDAVVLPPAGATRSRSVLAGASELVVFVAEMEAHRLVSFASTSEAEEDGGLVY
jgi:hypothetical protein